jgi:hypothetical protein
MALSYGNVRRARSGLVDLDFLLTVAAGMD